MFSKSIKIILFNLMVCLLTKPIFAKSNKGLKLDFSKKADVIVESQNLKISSESAVETRSERSKAHLSFDLGAWKFQSLKVSTPQSQVLYEPQSYQPSLRFSIDRELFDKIGSWGVGGSVGYSYMSSRNEGSSVVHWVPLSVHAYYRGEWKSNQTLSPFLRVGPHAMIFVQKGDVERKNTSEKFFLGAGEIGLTLNLNQIGLFSSRTPSLLNFSYQRFFWNSNSNADMSGGIFWLGTGLAI